MTIPPLDLPALRDRCVKALDSWTKGPTPPYLVFDASDVLALLDRLESAEKKVAAVREALESKVWQYPTMFHEEVDVIDVSDVLEALDGVPNA